MCEENVFVISVCVFMFSLLIHILTCSMLTEIAILLRGCFLVFVFALFVCIFSDTL